LLVHCNRREKKYQARENGANLHHDQARWCPERTRKFLFLLFLNRGSRVIDFLKELLIKVTVLVLVCGERRQRLDLSWV